MTTAPTWASPRSDGSPQVVLRNPFVRYYDEIQQHLDGLAASTPPGDSIGFELPELDERLTDFFGTSTVSWQPLGTVADRALSLLDLRSNPATRTTKTNPSLLIVARAVAHIQRTGERVVIVTPSSANKATALRDAVLRAQHAGLVDRDQLHIVTVVPECGLPKLWESELSRDPELQRRNPMLLLPARSPLTVKELVREFAGNRADHILPDGIRLWFTLTLDNYIAADIVRAYFEADYLPMSDGRVHAHAVSSAFGLLGHATGAEQRHIGHTSEYLLVQHLHTPDMVLDLYRDDFTRAGLPKYERCPKTGLWRQSVDPHFPATAYSPDEILDPTFYTHRPPTSPQMKRIIRQQGGAGIVVSLHECLDRYAAIRALLGPTGVSLPADPRQLREWSLVMAFTGVFAAVERALLPSAGKEIVVHASGSYAADDYVPMLAESTHLIEDRHDIAAHIRAAVAV
jgi:hypothetical protein